MIGTDIKSIANNADNLISILQEIKNKHGSSDTPNFVMNR